MRRRLEAERQKNSSWAWGSPGGRAPRDFGLSPERTGIFLSKPTRSRTFVEGVGLTPVEALKTATYFGAVALGIEKTRGSIEVGKAADFVVLSRDPSVDVKNPESVEWVIKDGRILSRTGK